METEDISDDEISAYMDQYETTQEYNSAVKGVKRALVDDALNSLVLKTR